MKTRNSFWNFSRSGSRDVIDRNEQGARPPDHPCQIRPFRSQTLIVPKEELEKIISTRIGLQPVSADDRPDDFAHSIFPCAAIAFPVFQPVPNRSSVISAWNVWELLFRVGP
jgi:hypothetical protein